MGQSKLPLYAYVDETGNTGRNVFDLTQPDFFTAAVITKGCFDSTFGAAVKRVADEIPAGAIHAGELGLGRLENIASELLRIMQAAKAHFFVSRVEKKYLITTKIFDVLFDSGENASVPWHVYNMKPLRLMLVFKLAAIIDEDVARAFWDCLLEPRENAVLAKLPPICLSLKRHLEKLPDARSRELLGEALDWAISHPECIHIHTERKLARQGHLPNMVAFANLLYGLDKHSRERKRQVAEIVHDQQSEFGKMLGEWHQMFSGASPEPIRWLGEDFVFQAVPESKFLIKSDNDSAGIQMADVTLWLYKQWHQDKRLPSNCAAFLEYVLDHGWESDFSLSGVQRQVMDQYGEMLFGPISREQEDAGKKLLKEFEAARLKSMSQYEADGLPPFMRTRSLPSSE